MREIFSNGAVTKLSRALSATGLKVYVQDAGMFPKPEVGKEFFYVSFAGTCDQKVDIARAVQNCGDCLILDQRGAQGTVAQAFVADDMAYHSITAASMQAVMDSWTWYLGPLPDQPSSDCAEGQLYYNTTVNKMFVCNGEGWVDVATPMPALASRYIYLFTEDQTGPFLLPELDVYGNPMIDLDSTRHMVEVFVNGANIPEMVDSEDYLGDFTVDYLLNQITLLHDLSGGAQGEGSTVRVVVHYVADYGDLTQYYDAHDEGYSDGYN